MAEEASRQHARAVRVLWDGDRVVAVGGVARIAQGEGLAFFWAAEHLCRRAWRLIWSTVFSIVWWAHEEDMRLVNAIVAANHIEGHRLIRRMGFEFAGTAQGFAGTTAPMLRYVHCSPPFEEPALVRHQRTELWRACLDAWCPRYLQEIA